MSGQPAFGRRQAPLSPLAPSAPPPRLPAASAPADSLGLGEAAEAFRAELRTQPKAENEFHEWRRSQRGSRLVAWSLRLALSAPGLISIVMDLPWYLSAGLSLGGLGLGIWLRNERRRHLKAIAAWSSEPSWE